jgi:RNase H-fold protein (predicted Holliday junction resolvase)
MAKKQRMMRSFARTAPKSQEKYLIENAKKLQEDPFLILPTCAVGAEKYFKKLRKQLTKIHRFSTDEAKLEKLSNKKGLDGALAGTLLLAISEKAPYLAALTFPTGDITYAQRGKADREKLIAVQHFDDPVFRLRGIRDIVFNKKLHVYSWDTGYVCTGREASPPSEFIDFITKKVGFPSTEHIIYCPHVPLDVARKKDALSLDYLRIEWKSANLIVVLCENCTKTTKNTMFTISKYMLQKNLSDDFDIEVITQVGKHSTVSATQRLDHLQEYLAGKVTDYEFLKKIVKSQEGQVKDGDEKILVLDGVSYGTDVTRFVDALYPNTHEKDALEYFLMKSKEPLIIPKTTSSKVLERYWEQYGNEFLVSILDDNKIADSLCQLDDTPSNILQLAYEYKQRSMILSQLPVYESLPPLATFADTVARTYMTFGEKKALIEIKKHPDTPKAKSIAYAFLLALGKGTEVKWKYTKEEIDYGEFLKDHAKRLLDVKPEKYSAVLQELLTACGSSEILP